MLCLRHRRDDGKSLVDIVPADIQAGPLSAKIWEVIIRRLVVYGSVATFFRNSSLKVNWAIVRKEGVFIKAILL